MLLTTQALAIIVAATRYAFELLQQGHPANAMEPKQVGLSAMAVLLFLVDLGVLIFTRHLVQHKRI